MNLEVSLLLQSRARSPVLILVYQPFLLPLKPLMELLLILLQYP